MKFLTDINEETKEVPKELLENELTREAVEYMRRAAYTKEELEAYDKWKIDVMTERSALNDAKNEGLSEGRVEGEAIGLEKGEAIGLEKGEAIGLEKGLEKGEQERVKLKQKIENLEKDKALEIAKNAKGVLGLSVEQIQKLTGLTKDEIEKL
jgi:predicted transposase YdaD